MHATSACKSNQKLLVDSNLIKTWKELDQRHPRRDTFSSVLASICVAEAAGWQITNVTTRLYWGRRHCIGYICIGTGSTFVSAVFNFLSPYTNSLLLVPLYRLKTMILYRHSHSLQFICIGKWLGEKSLLWSEVLNFCYAKCSFRECMTSLIDVTAQYHDLQEGSVLNIWTIHILLLCMTLLLWPIQFQ